VYVLSVRIASDVVPFVAAKLISCFVAGYHVKMKSYKNHNEDPRRNKQQNYIHLIFTCDDVEYKPHDMDVSCRLHKILNDLFKEQSDDTDQPEDKADKQSIVTLTNAHAQPGAVVIDFINASVADVAVGCSGRSVEKALIAELHLEVVGFDLKGVLSINDPIMTEHIPQKPARKRYKLLLWLLMLVQYFRDDSWINKGKD
jgi:hypothetical protein